MESTVYWARSGCLKVSVMPFYHDDISWNHQIIPAMVLF